MPIGGAPETQTGPSTFEDQLARYGYLVYKTKGVSMRPMLRENRDIVVIKPCSGPLRPLDVALYRRSDGTHVLHRVVGIAQDGSYNVRGDNTWSIERVGIDQVVGVLVSFKRSGKLEVSTLNPLYRAYARAWHALFPLRRLALGIRGIAARMVRRHIARHAADPGGRR